MGRIVFSGSRSTQLYQQDTVLYAAGSRRTTAEIPAYNVDFTQDKLSANLARWPTSSAPATGCRPASSWTCCATSTTPPTPTP